MKRKLLICMLLVALSSVSVIGCTSDKSKTKSDISKDQETMSSSEANEENKEDTNDDNNVNEISGQSTSSDTSNSSTSSTVNSTSNAGKDKSSGSTSGNSSSTSSSSKETSTNASNSAKSKKGSGTTKAQYEQKLKEIESNQTAFQSANTTLEMRQAANEEYKKYDKVLNEIYADLKSQLSSEEMSKLQKEETAWINTRDAKAEKDASKYEGGTLQPVEHITSLSNSTRDRCYELLEKYMK